MMKAFISDIHSNSEALDSVMTDIMRFNVDAVICLGDIVGYGPDPQSCIDTIINCADVVLMGNHDWALLNGPLGFNRVAAAAIMMQKEMLSPQGTLAGSDEETKLDNHEKRLMQCTQCETMPKCMCLNPERQDRWDFMKSLVKEHRDRDCLYVHGSPLDATFEYVLPDRINGWKPEYIQKMFENVDWLVFCGHTHLPCAIASDMTCYYPDQQNKIKLRQDLKYIINDGSVGQPRDRDNRACYAILDEENKTLEWRRVTYDIEKTVDKVRNLCGLDTWCGERLRVGR